MPQVLVSFVVPVYNAQRTLDACLSSVFAAGSSWGPFEVIVVDNDSTDGSADIARRHGATVLVKTGGTISSVRNCGAAMARGETLAFVDSDCVIAEDWVRESTRVLADPSVGATGSGYLAPADHSWVEKAWLYEFDRGTRRTDFLPGGNLCVRADVFRTVGGFDETLVTGEDSDICARIGRAGFHVVNSSAIRCVHLGNAKTLRQFVRKEFWYGAGMVRGLGDTPLDRTLALTIVYIACIAALGVGIVGSPLGLSTGWIVLPAACMLLVALVSACYRVRRSGKYRFLPHLVLLYFLYFVSRSGAVIKAVAGLLRNPAPTGAGPAPDRGRSRARP